MIGLGLLIVVVALLLFWLAGAIIALMIAVPVYLIWISAVLILRAAWLR
jgi:hypothetical protein